MRITIFLIFNSTQVRETMADDTKNEEKGSKPRKRMKKLLNNVQKQV